MLLNAIMYVHTNCSAKVLRKEQQKFPKNTYISKRKYIFQKYIFPKKYNF